MDFFDLENPLTADTFKDLHYYSEPDTSITSLFFIEHDHMPSQNYLFNLKTNDFALTIRCEAISSVLQCCYNLDSFLSYLAVNYLDRFLSSQGMPLEAKPWIVRLLAVSCVSLAAKMIKTELSLSVFQCGEGFIFDTQTIERMEILILGALKWRMRSITPFSFIQCFLSLFKLKDLPSVQALKARAFEIILKAQNEIELLEFKPSVMAASALLSACHELFPLQFQCFRKAISSCTYLNKEIVLKCYNTIEDVKKDGSETMLNMNSSSNTRINVLDQHYLSSDSKKATSITTQDIAPTTSSSKIRAEDREMKRQRLSEICKDNNFQLSQIEQC